MNGGHEDVDPGFLESLVEMILQIQRDADSGRLAAGGVSQFDPHLGVDVAGSINDLDAVPGPLSAGDLAGDGGDPRFTTRETDDGLLVVGDLRGVTGRPRETEVDLQQDSLIFTVDHRIVTRVPLDGGTSITDVSINNDILEVRVSVAD